VQLPTITRTSTGWQIADDAGAVQFDTWIEAYLLYLQVLAINKYMEAQGE
jgi:hypothetical protein